MENVKTLSLMGLPVEDREWLIDDYQIKDVVTRVYSSHSFIAEAVLELLRPFHRSLINPSSSRPEIEFYLVAKEDQSDLPSVPDPVEQFCDLDFLKCSQEGSLRYAEIPAGAFVVADLDENKALGFVLEKLEFNTWTIGHLVFYPLWAQMLKGKGLFPLHAAGAVKDGRGLIFPAVSGSGKSVLSFNLVREGYKLLADDTIFLYMEDGDVLVRGFPEKINFRHDALNLFPDLKSSPFVSSDGEREWKACLDIQKMYPGCFIDSARPHALIFPQVVNTRETSYEQISKADALGQLALYSLFFLDSSTSRDNFKVLSSLVNKVSCFKLQIGTDIEGLFVALENILQALDS